ncbi:keratin, type I cytoskeletal 18 isoform X1 [Polypterus senegalus]|uniref:keratin, type I cytoskeletal 18 isoform X1 n=1 Tax=Polypterus senegalus TaxID=55291 RepID=UPI001964E54D|nr:keratin, type I cytoskeletal 18 isoform X1 [Polypterus senegalus]
MNRSMSRSSLMSSSAFQNALRSSAATVFGEGGGRAARIAIPAIQSLTNNLRSSLDLNALSAVVSDKETMQGLNDRLAGYLSRVRGLEEANMQLESQIKDLMTKRGSTERDWSAYEKQLSELRKQVSDMTMDNARLLLQIDNARLAADDFRVKWESELAMRQSVEQDIYGLRKIIDDTNVSRMQLENQIESMKEELAYLKKNHEEEVNAIQSQINNCQVDVNVKIPKSVDLSETIEQIRNEYEKVAQKNREDTEAWYKSKFDEISTEVSHNTEALQKAKSEINELRRQKTTLEIDIQTLVNMNRSLEDNLRDTENRYNIDMTKLNQIILGLEAELGDVRRDIERQAQEYTLLLNTKVKLEAEIATYRRLLEGEEERSQPVMPLKAEPVKQTIKKVVVINQELVDGKVVSHREEEIQQ